MNIFQKVKERVTARQVAEKYGLKVRQNGMACCPFHNDKRSPSWWPFSHLKNGMKNRHHEDADFSKTHAGMPRYCSATELS